MDNIHKFVDHASDIETLRGSQVYEAMMDANSGDLTALKNLYTSGYSLGSESLKSGTYRLLGWQFNFRPFCKRYLVHLRYYGWTEYMTPNKTCLYKLIGRHNVIEILEI